jgi:excisionase family DNA binding protein
MITPPILKNDNRAKIVSAVNPVRRSLTIADAAGGLACSTKTITRLIARQELVAYKLGWQWRIEVADLEAYIRQQKNACQRGGRS